MTNREAIQRLSVNKYDRLAVASLHENNAGIIRAAIDRYFGAGPVADKAESALMQRMADHARLYEHPEDPDAWLARCANTECDRLRNEAIWQKSDED